MSPGLDLSFQGQFSVPIGTPLTLTPHARAIYACVCNLCCCFVAANQEAATLLNTGVGGFNDFAVDGSNWNSGSQIKGRVRLANPASL